MRLGKIYLECGIIRDGQKKIVFDKPLIDRNCNQGCTVYVFGCFYFTVLRKGCAYEKID